MALNRNTDGAQRSKYSALPDGFEAELIEAAERDQIGCSEGSVEHVGVFRMGSVGTSILRETSTPIAPPSKSGGYTLFLEEPLKRHKLLGSMGRVGVAGDNAAMESFFSLLQKNVLDRHPWSTRLQLRLAIVQWIEGIYHRKRRQRRLGKLTPIEFETIMMEAVDLAA